MVQFSFDEKDAPKSVVLPRGEYLLHAIESELKTTKRGDGQYLRFRFAVASGNSAGASVWMNFNVANPNDMAVQIGKRQLAEFSRAVGVPNWTNTQDLHNKVFKANVDIEPGTNGMEDSNTIKKFLRDESGVDPLRTGGNFDVENGPSGAQPHTVGGQQHAANGAGQPQSSHMANGAGGGANGGGRPDWGQRTG